MSKQSLGQVTALTDVPTVGVTVGVTLAMPANVEVQPACWAASPGCPYPLVALTTFSEAMSCFVSPLLAGRLHADQVQHGHFYRRSSKLR